MLRTSIQARGTATTTSALPKPSGARNVTRRSASGTASRSKSSPATPRWACPSAKAPTISAAGRKAISRLGNPGSVPR